MLPPWLNTEENVTNIFSFLGFKTVSCSIQGRQIDLIATLRGKFHFQDENWIIEITTEKVDADKGSSDYQKLALANKDKFNDTAKMMLVTTSGFTGDQKTSLEKLGVVALTFSELESTIGGLNNYALNSLRHFEGCGIKDIGYDGKLYIPVSFKILNSKTKTTTIVSSKTWIDDVLNPANMGVCSLLGNLGCGKTSALQKIWQEGCSKYISNDLFCSLPIFIPLGKYKQHSGDIMQMIMSEFRLAGITDFPSGLIEHYIRSGRIVLLLDGLDEVHPINNTDDILDTISTILSLFSKQGKAVISCRRHFFESVGDEQGYFGSYTYFKNSLQIQTEIRKLFSGTPSTYISYLEPFSEDNIYEYLDIRCRLSKVECDNIFKRFYGFRDMCATPVLLAMIASTISEKTLDIDKISDYPLLDLYEAYINRWIKRDKSRSKLPEELKIDFSKKIAVRFMREPISSCDWVKVRSVLKEDPEWGKTIISEEEAQREIRTGGFLICDDDNKFRFVHRSIMEYLCATADMRSYSVGGKPQPSESDGHKKFMDLLVARSLEQNVPVWPSNCWYDERGEEVLRYQSEMIIGGVLQLANKTTIKDIPNLVVDRELVVKGMIFENINIKLLAVNIQFTDCSFVGATFRPAVKIDFDGCKFERCSYFGSGFDQIPNIKIQTKIHNSLALPVGCFVAATLFDMGLVINIDNKEWKLTVKQLNDFNDVIGSIKGKAQIANVSRGKNKTILMRIYRKLMGDELLKIDESRPSHQVELTPKMRQLIEGFKHNPMNYHHKIQEVISRIQD